MRKASLYTVASSLFFAACTAGNAGSPGESEERAYPVVELKAKDTILQLQYVADIQARKNVELHARVPGILEKIYVDEGQHVQKGQLLFRINAEELTIELEKAQAAYNSVMAEVRVAEVEVERVKLLVDKKIITATELDLAEAKRNALQAKAEEAQAAMANAKKRLSYTLVHSPFEGVIDRLPLKEGSLLNEGSLLTTISDLDAVFAYFNLSENEYFQLMKSDPEERPQTVQLVLADGTLYPHPGKIEAAESEIDERTGSIAFRASFPNPDQLLKHGASGKLIISRQVKNALLVPQKAVFEIQDKNYVYLLGDDNSVKMTEFVPARRMDRFYIVGSGLKASDRIVYEGIQSLRDGETIRAELITEHTAPKGEQKQL